MPHKIIDHLFRHQYGKMVAILTHVFGLQHIERIEDAVQDTFIQATLKWRNQMPDKPEAWLMSAAKNRMVDLLRKTKTESKHTEKLVNGSISLRIDELFLDHEIADSQLRMIFVACHPSLAPQEQIAFALKTISGFSTAEIAASLLVKEETIKKRLIRARKSIAANNIKFEFPSEGNVQARIHRVLEVIYLTFNEGFHSTHKDQLIRKDLCGEALRLCTLLLKKKTFRSGSVYALFALICFHSSRLESKVNEDNEIVDLRNQDRSLWYFPLITMGNDAMNQAMEYDDLSIYHMEATIAAEHLKTSSFSETNWNVILECYKKIDNDHSSPSSQLSLAIVHLQLGQLDEVFNILESIEVQKLEQRAYIYHGAFADYFEKIGELGQAVLYLNQSIDSVKNNLEKKYLEIKRSELELRLKNSL
ncbi:MAG: sigma-70 family RNA polymerase sigma factor [Reichenbachiella sp.]